MGAAPDAPTRRRRKRVWCGCLHPTAPLPARGLFPPTWVHLFVSKTKPVGPHAVIVAYIHTVGSPHAGSPIWPGCHPTHFRFSRTTDPAAHPNCSLASCGKASGIRHVACTSRNAQGVLRGPNGPDWSVEAVIQVGSSSMNHTGGEVEISNIDRSVSINGPVVVISSECLNLFNTYLLITFSNTYCLNCSGSIATGRHCWCWFKHSQVHYGETIFEKRMVNRFSKPAYLGLDQTWQYRVS